ncbi:N-(5'-phosphoribosyl)anthranilate isomerase [Flavobacterium crassostreae]|uniref:N-(5'-phosphoribosyl)anthranilate isomerase n=2 Tax=Flavobacterium crassostreae TaxID=1763534 RepID=A0A1B9EA10_9FLAO|nr:N-(5'-phosphoribosyl)anthranilate isomerase [Flavobacterium crassostreae]
MKYPENILEIAALQPDYMGFIFWEKSARYFDGVLPELPKSIQKTGVFVQETIPNILQKVNQYHLQAVQLHGNESVAYCTELQKTLPKNIQIIKVFSVLETFDFNALKPFEPLCDYFLFDTKGKLPGGNGTSFDWKMLENYPSTKPFFLSGGIGLDQMDAVSKILKTKLPVYAIDVNSKFETEPALKNKSRCLEAINTLNTYQHTNHKK